eukprot:TRINITY_DN1320_c0_g2_i1.p1 TRINITY_DN1320_c0_g2~~TRINITY_DN1320_c0_g2_i1.p1  ORF type:complete len:105 (-),score=5.77 TRINITY_DN1320_c0_g2_i1:923-1237(-)
MEVKIFKSAEMKARCGSRSRVKIFKSAEMKIFKECSILTALYASPYPSAIPRLSLLWEESLFQDTLGVFLVPVRLPFVFFLLNLVIPSTAFMGELRQAGTKGGR